MGKKNQEMRIDRKVMWLGNRIIYIENISEVTTASPRPELPMGMVYCLLIGIVAVMLGGMIGALVLIGFVLIAFGGYGLYRWNKACNNPDKGLAIHLNSGEIIRIISADHDLIDGAINTITKSMNSETYSITYDLRDSEITDSQVGGMGNVISHG